MKESWAAKAVKIALIVAASAFPVVLYDRLVARELLRRSQEESAGALTPAQAITAFHLLFYNSMTWYQTRWLGVTTWQNPNDVWTIQEIISEVKPDLIVEAGTAYGGSALIWAMIQDQVNPTGRVVTIDIQDVKDKSKIPKIGRSKVDYLIGSSTAPEIVAEVARRAKGGRVMVILDSDHSKGHVLEELRAYSPMVNVGSYVIVEDTDVNGHPVRPDFGPGPMEAVEEFLAGNDQFVSDRTRERLLFTQHPRGYLKRVK